MTDIYTENNNNNNKELYFLVCVPFLLPEGWESLEGMNNILERGFNMPESVRFPLFVRTSIAVGNIQGHNPLALHSERMPSWVLRYPSSGTRCFMISSHNHVNGADLQTIAATDKC